MKKSGVPVEAMTTAGPYKLQMADLYWCPICQIEIITGFAQKPVREHFEPDYTQTVAGYRHITRYWRNYTEKIKYGPTEISKVGA